MLPAACNFHMPAEWARHQRTLVAWPVQASMCHPEDFDRIRRGYREIIGAIAEFEPVTVIINPGEQEYVSRYLEAEKPHSGRIAAFPVDLLPIPHDDAWLRDNGPTFLTDNTGCLAGVNWQFNAWGGKYAPFDLDDAVAPSILDHFGIRRFDAPLVLEGGSIHADGEGTLLTTEECLLNRNRNPALNRAVIERQLQDHLAVSKIIWLKAGLSGDETDGHIDNIACFAAPGKVLIQVCDDPDDENYAITRESLAVLSDAVDARGRKLEILAIRQPPRAEYLGRRLTLSYLNFYFVNGGIILPVFGGAAAKTDEMATAALAGIFPERRIRRVDGLAIVTEGGNVHCMTQQMTEGKFA